MVTATPSRKKASSGSRTLGRISRSRMRAWRRAERLRRDDEFAPRQRQRRRARDPHEGGNAEHAENAGEVEDRLPEIRDDGQRQDQRRKRQQHVHAADDERFETAAEISRQHAERAADRDADDRRAKPDRRARSARRRSARASSSRPRPSVPSQCSMAEAGARRSSMSMSVGLGSGNTLANAAAAKTKIIQPIAAQNSGPSRRCPRNRTGNDILVDGEFKRGHGGSWDRARRRACRR